MTYIRRSDILQYRQENILVDEKVIRSIPNAISLQLLQLSVAYSELLHKRETVLSSLDITVTQRPYSLPTPLLIFVRPFIVLNEGNT